MIYIYDIINLNFISHKYQHGMKYSSYITSMEHKDSYTINVLYIFTLHTPVICVTMMTDIACFSDVSHYDNTNGWYMLRN